VPAVLSTLQVEPASGLSAEEAARRLKQYGPNELLTHPPTTAARILVNQLKGPVVWLLATAAAIAALFGEWTEAIAILLVLATNTAIGFATELRAVRSMESLRKLGSWSSRVLRDGTLKILSAEQVVPGDIVLFESGDVVTADIRLIEANTLYCDESTLTGESTPVEKGTAPVASDATVADRSSMLHKGTAITGVRA
jgi:Ca2+-transporting ATPase